MRCEDVNFRLFLFLNRTNGGTFGGRNGRQLVPTRRDRSCKGHISENRGTQLLARADKREKYEVFLAHWPGEVKRIDANRPAACGEASAARDCCWGLIGCCRAKATVCSWCNGKGAHHLQGETRKLDGDVSRRPPREYRLLRCHTAKGTVGGSFPSGCLQIWWPLSDLLTYEVLERCEGWDEAGEAGPD